MQVVGDEHRLLRYIEDWQECYSTFTSRLADLDWTFGTHYLPHDAGHEWQGAKGVLAPVQILGELAPHWQFAVLPPIARQMDDIEFTCKPFPRAVFGEEGCKAGFIHVSNDQARWNSVAGALAYSARTKKRSRRAAGGMAA